MEMDHIGIAVESIDRSLPAWRALGATVTGEETVPEQGVRVLFLDTGGAPTELLEPLDEGSPIARFLASGRRGLHHVAYRVTDIEAVLERLRATGVPLLDERPRGGSRGTRVAFVHPRGLDGVLVELVEYPAPADGERR